MNPGVFFLQYFESKLGALLLGNLPLFPWWVWFLIMIAIWGLLIWLAPLPWWAWVLLTILTALYLFASFIFAFVPGPQG